jgi:glycosyltransferase involved in cell wall biosynthesis
MDNKNDLISVLMPTYNVEEYVEEAVRSILNQTWTNFELIIVDDCSTDKTFDILRGLANEDPRIRIYRNKENSKICQTLNRAWSHAKGNYIARMDGDDISTSDRFQVLMDFLYEHKKCGLVGSGMITIDENGKELSRPSFLKSNKYIRYFNSYKSCITHIWIARREVYEKLNGYREIPYAEDYDFVLRCIRLGYEVANADAYVYKVRIRNGNTGSTNGLAQYKAKDYVLNLYKNEKRDNVDRFLKDDYKKSIYCTQKELKKFEKARENLDVAIHNKNNKVKMLKYTLAAMAGSSYIFRYVLDSLYVRLGIKLEHSY